MGIFDSIKNAFGKGDSESDVTTPPSQVLREAGIDPSGLEFGFSTGTITVSGPIASESDRQRILDALAGIEGIETVEDRLTVEDAAADAPADASPAGPVASDSVASEPAAAEPPSVESAPPAEEAAAEGGGERSYTVVSGDTLWRIAEREYGKGSEYMKIYEANTDILEHPDRIFPGQKLRIPKL